MPYIRKIDNEWYAFDANVRNGQVYSIGSDCPSDGGAWFASLNNNGIKYVASPSPTRKAAYERARRNGGFGGEI